MLGNVQIGLPARQIFLLILVAPLLFACQTVSEYDLGKNQLTSKPLNDKEQSTVKKVFSATLTPLEDLGVRKREIPEMLKMLSENPYMPPTKVTCDEVKHEMADLTVLLGPDVDTPKMALSAQEQMMEDGSTMVEDAVVGLVRSQTSIIPLRGIVRRLTGANSHEKKVTQAVEAGKLRRAYLRGIAHAKFDNACIPHPQVITATAEPKNDAELLEIAKK